MAEAQFTVATFRQSINIQVDQISADHDDLNGYLIVPINFALHTKHIERTFDLMNLVYGIGLIFVGTWISIVQIKYLRKNKSDFLASHFKMLAGGLTFVAGGIALIIQNN